MDWVFAYGSLLPAGHAMLPEGAVAADLHGWRRSWSVAMDNSVDLPDYKHYVGPDGHRPDLMVASSYHERVLAGFDVLRQRRRFERLTEPAGVPIADLSLVRHAPLAVPRSVR